jgi:ATP-binding cassette subfamily F protein uup
MKNPNFLILDEPTNDLDILTLNVLEDYLAGFRGCVIVVSHDRYFMDKVVDHIFEYKGEGVLKDFPGNYTQLREKNEETEIKTLAEKIVKSSKPVNALDLKVPHLGDLGGRSVKKEKKPGLTFKEKREFEELSVEINHLEAEKGRIENDMNQGLLSQDELYMKSIRHGEIVKILDSKEMRWLELSEK